MLILTHVWLVRQETLVVDQRPIGLQDRTSACWYWNRKGGPPPFILLALVLPVVYADWILVDVLALGLVGRDSFC